MHVWSVMCSFYLSCDRYRSLFNFCFFSETFTWTVARNENEPISSSDLITLITLFAQTFSCLMNTKQTKENRPFTSNHKPQSTLIYNGQTSDCLILFLHYSKSNKTASVGHISNYISAKDLRMNSLISCFWNYCYYYRVLSAHGLVLFLQYAVVY